MAVSSIRDTQHIVEVTCEPIDVTPFQEKDSTWVYIDKEGHEHRWHIPHGTHDWSKEGYWTLPTLRAVTYVCGYADDGDEMYGTHYYCKRCGEHIEPGWKVTIFRHFTQGPKRFYIDGVETSQKGAEKVLRKMKPK